MQTHCTLLTTLLAHAAALVWVFPAAAQTFLPASYANALVLAGSALDL